VVDRRQFLISAVGSGLALTLGCVDSSPDTHAASVKEKPKVAAAGGHWPVYRGGPAMQGVAGGTLVDKPALIWQFKTKDAIKSSPVVADGTVFIGSNDGNLYALELATGKQRWAYQVGQKKPNSAPEAIEAPPMVHEGTVYVGASDFLLYAIDAKTGKLRWRYETEGEILGSANWFKAPDGKSTWILVGSYDNKLHCIDAGTGKKVWAYETDNYINGAPSIDDGRIAFGGCDGYVHVVKAKDGTKEAEIEIESYIAGTMALRNGYAYTGHMGNRFVSVDLQRRKMKWKYRSKEFAYYASPAVTEKYAVIGSRDKRLHCVERDTGNSVWQFRTQGEVDSSPVICGDRVVVGSGDGRLYMVGLTDGEMIWNYEIGQPVSGSPAVVDGRILIGAEDGVLYAFGPVK